MCLFSFSVIILDWTWRDLDFLFLFVVCTEVQCVVGQVINGYSTVWNWRQKRDLTDISWTY